MAITYERVNLLKTSGRAKSGEVRLERGKPRSHNWPHVNRWRCWSRVMRWGNWTELTPLGRLDKQRPRQGFVESGVKGDTEFSYWESDSRGGTTTNGATTLGRRYLSLRSVNRCLRILSPAVKSGLSHISVERNDWIPKLDAKICVSKWPDGRKETDCGLSRVDEPALENAPCGNSEPVW